MELQDTDFYKNHVLQFHGRQLDLSSPRIMGILNLTPDSFYDGGKYISEKDILLRVENLIEEGVDIIDVGAASTRPGAELIPFEEELSRLIHPLEQIRKKFPEAIISVDTYSSGVAKATVEAGADMINDVSGGSFDPKMFKTAGSLNVPYVLMHIKGSPKDMQREPYYKDVVKEVISYFESKIEEAKLAGIKQLVLDPGFGFGKTTEHNFRILNELKTLCGLGLPLLIGVSRKGMINKVLGTSPNQSLNGTTVVNTIGLMNGANILRVHDAKEAREAATIIKYCNSLKQKS